MSSINSLNSGSCIGATFSTQTNKLSEATKAKLQALGIDPSSVSSEAEALTLIAQVEAMSKSDKARPQSNSSEQSLITQARKLAEKIGVQLAQTDTLDNMCKKIANKLEQLAEQCGNDNTKLQTIQGYQNELASIDARYQKIHTNQESIFAAMNMISNSNKYALGLK